MTHLNVNTIEFNGMKAVINSSSDHPALINSMNDQRERFAARFPNATVKTERMTEAETMALVAAQDKIMDGRHGYSWRVGEASEQ